jgi:hypothetical protein
MLCTGAKKIPLTGWTLRLSAQNSNEDCIPKGKLQTKDYSVNCDLVAQG